MSKKVDQWMPLFIDQYLGDTAHLNTEKHGAYLLLLMACWKGGGYIKKDMGSLAAITRMTPQRWRVNQDVLLAFFQDDGSYLCQKRLSKELEVAHRMSNLKSEAGSKGAAKRWNTDGTANGPAISKAIGLPLAVLPVSEWQEHALTGTPIPIPKRKRKETTPLTPLKGADDRFEKFWKAYPSKIGKVDARKSFEKANPDDAQLAVILAAIEKQKLGDRWRKDGGQYIPNPATWLNHGRWDDETLNGFEVDTYRGKTL